ncbi:ABC transporter permease [Auraticoccus monumenti]|uniref:Peptide/nickel transport system permease protein n=1 Tax=Auraticoccus monumenti TaxID=675864 RepID=A0A1G6YME8_9ACTN|nr:ABC transporter permease [Auraticoccus monumenti]SDD91481.1 peptide/nickel transport system permease protein [Auraticoccus monumenti]
MGLFILKRLLNYAVLLFVAISLTYFLAASQLNPRALWELANPPIPPQTIEASLRSKNLSDEVPLLQRYWTWLTGVVLHWDWGESPRTGDIAPEIGRRIGVSIRLITLGSLGGIALGVLVGAWTATRQYRLSDRAITLGSLAIYSVPVFVLISVIQVLATSFNDTTGWRVFEFVGETGQVGSYPGAWLVDRAQHLLLPTVVLVLANAAFFSRIQRNLMLDALGSDYVRTARAKGLRQGRAVMKHALRTSLIPTGTYFAFSVATLFLGSTFVEVLFSFHGMGEFAITTIQGQDVHGAVAVAAFGGVCVLVGATLSDFMVAALDPRVRVS